MDITICKDCRIHSLYLKFTISENLKLNSAQCVFFVYSLWVKIQIIVENHLFMNYKSTLITVSVLIVCRMIGVPGVAQRLFGSLHKMGISVILISQASSEHSISVAIDAKHSSSALVSDTTSCSRIKLSNWFFWKVESKIEKKTFLNDLSQF